MGVYVCGALLDLTRDGSPHPQEANTTTIRTAYRKLSLHWHPDKVRQSIDVA